MPRIAGVILPNEKTSIIALTAIFGIGRTSSKKILSEARVDKQKRIKDLTEQEENRIRSIIEQNYKIEGDLRSVISSNIRRLKDIQSFRGIRHIKNLPVRGQRTKTNARTKRGKKITVGSGRKKSAEKT